MKLLKSTLFLLVCLMISMLIFDGTQNRPLTTGEQNDRSPRWSHDGKKIVGQKINKGIEYSDNDPVSEGTQLRKISFESFICRFSHIF